MGRFVSGRRGVFFPVESATESRGRFFLRCWRDGLIGRTIRAPHFRELGVSYRARERVSLGRSLWVSFGLIPTLIKVSIRQKGKN